MRMKEADWKAFNTVKPVTDVSTVDSQFCLKDKDA